MKQLLLMRHAEAQSLGTSNLARSLTVNGVVQAKSIQKQLNDLGIKIDTVLCSKAVRTKQTFEALNLSIIPTYSEILFSQDSFSAILQEVTESGLDANVLLVVMHMPSILDLANHFGANLDSFGKASLAFFEVHDSRCIFQQLINPRII